MEEVTTIKVNKGTWKRLSQIKLDNNFNTFDETINKVLDDRKDLKEINRALSSEIANDCVNKAVKGVVEND